MKLVLVVALFVLACLGQQFTNAPAGGVDIIVIDDFLSGGTDFLQIRYSDATVYPISTSSIIPLPGSVVGERDHVLTVTYGESFNALTSSIDLGRWAANTPVTGRGYAYIQWDGIDNSVELSAGLNLDFGTGNFLHLKLGNDVTADFQFQIVSPGGGLCRYTYTSPGTEDTRVEDIYIPFSVFSGNCNWRQVGGIEARIIQEPNVDAVLQLVTVFGVLPSASPTPTPTSTPSPIPSNSQTPTPIPSSSQTPTPTPTNTPTPTSTPSTSRSPPPTPSPTGSGTPSRSFSRTPTPTPSGTRTPTPTGTSTVTPSPSRTRTPSPTMLIDWYTFDDDDEGKSPCSDDRRGKRTYFLSDDNIIYYYFYGFGDDHDGGAGLGLFTEPVRNSGNNLAVSAVASVALAFVLMVVF